MMRRASAYWGCALTEVVGAVMILWHGVPIYRALLEGEASRMPARTLLWAALGTILIQGAYVIRWRLVAIPRFGSHMIVGHVVMFLGRLNFVFVSGVFSAIFIIRFHQLQFSLWRAVVLFAVLFAMFCFSLELERLGRALSSDPASGHDIAGRRI
jgi:hypothetical protein